jgi:hypothetical protein
MSKPFTDHSGDRYMPRPGEKVLVPTEVKAGAFPGERLVTVSTDTGPISGFAKADAIIAHKGGSYLIGEIKNISGSSSTVKLSGSFFTTTGLANIQTSRILKAAG